MTLQHFDSAATGRDCSDLPVPVVVYPNTLSELRFERPFGSDRRRVRRFYPVFLFFITLGIMITVTGCDFWAKITKKRTEPPKGPEAVKVLVMAPTVRNVIDYEEFTGETDAVDEVEIRAQVSGFLKSCLFKEGGEVAKGDILFEIEPEIYQAQRDVAQGALDSLLAKLPQLESDVVRYQELQAHNAASKSEYEKVVADRDECRAKIKQAEAEVTRTDIDLKYTKIISPIAGYISRKLVTEGNIIQPKSGSNSTLMAMMVSLDPIYVVFHMDEGTYLKLIDKEMKRHENDPNHAAPSPVIEFHLTTEEGYIGADGKPLHTGTIEYSDPFMDKASGTILLRATCSNPKNSVGARTLLPGMTVHVRIPTTSDYEAVLVPEEALGTDQGTRFAYVLDTQNQAQMRRLTLGPLQSDNMRVVRSGLSKGDTVIVTGLLRLRPGSLVEPSETTIDVLREGIGGVEE